MAPLQDDRTQLPFGDPFFMRIREEEPMSAIKQRIQV